MSNFINYQVEATPDNKALIDQINNLLLEGKVTTTPTTSKPVMEAKGKADKAKTDTATETKSTTKAPTLTAFKKAAKEAKTEYGEEFVMQAMEDAGVEVGTTIGRTISKVDQDDYNGIMEAWEKGPAEEDDLEEDDGLGDDDDLGEEEAQVDPDAVKTALRAYVKSVGRDEAKAIMKENGANVLSDVDGLSQAQLASIMKAVV